MQQAVVGRQAASGGWTRWQTLKEILAIVGALRQIEEPLTSATGLRASIDLLLRLAESAGVEPAWTDRLRRILEDDDVLAIVLAIARFVLPDEAEGDGLAALSAADGAIVESESFVEWLPIVVQALYLLRQLRGGK